MFGHSSRRVSLVVLLTAVVTVCAFAGTALAVQHKLSIKAPSGAKAGKKFLFTISGFAGKLEAISYFVDPKTCGRNPHVEAVVRKAKGGEDIVVNSFKKTLSARVSKAGTYHVCAYLVLISDYGYYPARGVILRKDSAFTVR